MTTVSGPAGTDEPRSTGRAGLGFLLLFLMLTAAIAALGLVSYRSLQQVRRTEMESQLSAIADLKVAEIVSWRQERSGDAKVVLNLPLVADGLRMMLADPSRDAERRKAAAFLEVFRQSYNYKRIVVLDRQLAVWLSLPPLPDADAEPLRRLVRGVLEDPHVVFTDLHRASERGGIRLDIVVPLEVPSPPSALAGRPSDRASVGDRTPIGAIVLEIDPQQYLFPLIQTWPTPSPTAETLLVRRDGEDVLFLNELRHRKGTAMSMRRSIRDARLPAAMGVRGETSVQRGVDYRGVPVVAATRAVPGTAWFMVAKVDEAELFAPLRRQALSVVAVGLALVVASAFGVAALWRRRNEHAVRAQLVAERQRRTLAERYGHLMRHIGDAIVLADEENHILEVNDAGLALYGYSLAEMQALELPALRSPEARASFESQADAMSEAGRGEFLTMHRRRDGSDFAAEVRSRFVHIGASRFKLGIIRDVSQRQAHEAEIERLNRLYATLSQVNQTIVRCEGRQELLASICRVVVEFGRFRGAWIGWKAEDGTALTPVAHHAAGWEPEPTGVAWPGRCGIVDDVLRTGCAYLCNDIEADPRTATCRAKLAGLEGRSCAAFPVRFRGEVRGTLGVCSAELGFFDAAMVRLLEEVVADVSFALDRLEKEAQRARAEAALQDNERFIRAVLDSLPVGIAVNSVDPTVTFGYVNEAFTRIYRVSREQLTSPDAFWTAIYEDPTYRDAIRARVLADCESGDPARMYWPDVPIAKQGEPTTFITARNIPLPHEHLVISVVWDVTERKRLEEERWALEAQLRQQQKLESIGTLAGGVAHEINNPINGIMNYAQLIQDRLPVDSPLTEFTGEILHETERVATIVRNLLTFARNETQSHSLARVEDIVEHPLSLIRTVMRHDQITLTVDVPKELPSLRCRSQQIEQVLMNLLTNARDALNERFPGHDPAKTLSVTARSIDKGGHGWIRVTVEDGGTGIPPNVRERIFDPFFTTKSRDRGTGLGLSISHGIIKDHAGELIVESEPGEWTRFHMDLPVNNQDAL
jgi:two-component system, cell cycle sensor histidine kinase and response regulator CckA